MLQPSSTPAAPSSSAKPDAANTGWVAGTPYTAAELSAYAARILEAGGVEPGDEICVRYDHPSAMALVEELRRQAEERGAAALHPIRPLEQMSSREIAYGLLAASRMRERRGVRIQLDSWWCLDDGRELAEEELRRDEEVRHHAPASNSWAKRVELSRRFMRTWNGHSASEDRWTTAPWPTAQWAELCLPDAEPERAFWAMGQTLLRAVGASPLFGSDDYSRHLDELERKADRLNELGICELTIIDDVCTFLTLRVADGSRWRTCTMRDSRGRRFQLNLPSAEIFTTPDPKSVRGLFRASAPAMAEIVLADRPACDVWLDVEGEFVDGRATFRNLNLIGSDALGDELLEETFSSLKGTDRLGEIGLAVPSGPMAGAPPTCLLPALDEQSGVHLGFGRSYSHLTGGEGTPHSGPHEDVVIGRASTVVSGTDRHGGEHLLIAGNRWRI